MKRRIFFHGIMCLWFLGSLIAGVSAKSYRIDRVDIRAEVLQDGSLKITETRTYSFKGSFRWADYRLPRKGFGSISDFRLTEGMNNYVLADTEEPGTYQINESDSEFYAKWFYRAKNEQRSFVLSFRVHDVVTAFNDVAELYYQFVGSGWKRPSGAVHVEVLLPGKPDPERVKAWAHGPLWGTVKVQGANHVEFDVAPLPANQYWEGRILFPPELVPQATKRVDKPHLAEVLTEETRWAEEANRKRQAAIERAKAIKARKRVALPYLIIVCLLVVGIWITHYLRFGRAYPGREPGKLYSDIPSDLHPVWVSYLMSQRQIHAGSLMAAILNLARRGFLRIQEQRIRKKIFFKEKEVSEYLLVLNREFYEKHRDELESFEDDIVELLFSDLARGVDQIGMKELGKSRTKIRPWFRTWRKKIVAIAKEKRFFDAQSEKAMIKMMILSGALVLLGALSIIWLHELGVIPVLVGLILFFLSLMFPRISKEFTDEFLRWKKLRVYLRKYGFSNMHSQPLGDQIDRYVVYAVALGLSSKALKKLLEKIPSEMSSSAFPWFAYYHSTGSSFADSFSGMMTVAGTQFSSATGTSGGASAGGGGGAGGSGGGAG